MAKYTFAYFDNILKQRPLTLKERKALSNFKHSDKVNARTKAWRRANPEKTAAQAARARQNRLKREPDFERRTAAEWRESRPDYWRCRYELRTEAYAESCRQYRQANPEKMRHQGRKRRARLKGAPGSHTMYETEMLFDRQAGLCGNPYCKQDLNVVVRHLDHIVPLARGGSDAAENLQWLCQSCNSRKSALPQAEWLEREAVRAADCQTARTALECSLA